MADWLPPTIQSTGMERTLKAGQVLFRAGQQTAELYQVVSGIVRLERMDRTGREAVLQVAMAGDTLAEASLFSPTYHCDAIATTDAVVRFYPKALILDEFERNLKAARAFTEMLARQVMTLRMRLEQRNIHSARDRVRHYLALNVGADRRTVTVPGTLKSLAGQLGLSHETVYRTLANMAAAGEIERLKGKIVLAKPAV